MASYTIPEDPAILQLAVYIVRAFEQKLPFTKEVHPETVNTLREITSLLPESTLAARGSEYPPGFSSQRSFDATVAWVEQNCGLLNIPSPAASAKSSPAPHPARRRQASLSDIGSQVNSSSVSVGPDSLWKPKNLATRNSKDNQRGNDEPPLRPHYAKALPSDTSITIDTLLERLDLNSISIDFILDWTSRIDAELRELRSKKLLRADEIGTAKESVPAEPPANLDSWSQTPVYVSQTTFKPNDIGLFDPDNEKEPIEVKDSYMIYHSVISFTNRLKVFAELDANVEAIKTNLHRCMLGAASRWHAEELNTQQRLDLHRGGSKLDLWIEKLTERFRESPRKALAALRRTFFTVDDVCAGKDPQEFVSRIIRLGESSGLAVQEHAQVSTAYQHFGEELRLSLPCPTPASTISEFMLTVRDKSSAWADTYGDGLTRARQTAAARLGTAQVNVFQPRVLMYGCGPITLPGSQAQEALAPLMTRSRYPQPCGSRYGQQPARNATGGNYPFNGSVDGLTNHSAFPQLLPLQQMLHGTSTLQSQTTNHTALPPRTPSDTSSNIDSNGKTASTPTTPTGSYKWCQRPSAAISKPAPPSPKPKAQAEHSVSQPTPRAPRASQSAPPASPPASPLDPAALQATPAPGSSTYSEHKARPALQSPFVYHPRRTS